MMLVCGSVPLKDWKNTSQSCSKTAEWKDRHCFAIWAGLSCSTYSLVSWFETAISSSKQAHIPFGKNVVSQCEIKYFTITAWLAISSGSADEARAGIIKESTITFKHIVIEVVWEGSRHLHLIWGQFLVLRRSSLWVKTLSSHVFSKNNR